MLGVTMATVALEDVVGGALDELGLAPGEVASNWLRFLRSLPTRCCLQRALVNLLANAVRFTPPGGAPIVSTSALGDRVQLRVIDSGPGIPEARREDVFMPFQRLGDTDNHAGVGLGLALSKGFVEAMGGTLEAEDTPGGGLTMVIELAAAS